MKAHTPILGHLAAFFTITVWGAAFVSTKVLLVPFTPVEILFYRLILAVLLMTAASPPRLKFSKPDQKGLIAELKPAAAGLCGVTLYYIFQNIALTHTLATNVSVLVSVAPLFTALASRVVLKEKLKTNFFLGFSVAIAGIILITFNGSFVLKLNPLGDVLALLAALAWGLYSVVIKQISAGDLAAVTRKVLTYGLLFLLPLLPLFEFRLGLERLLVLPNLLNLLFLGAFGMALCYFIWNYAVHRLGPVKASVYLYLVPVVTIAASALVLKERITLAAGIGMALILAGMALSERGKAG